MSTHLYINVISSDSLSLETYNKYFTSFDKVTLYSLSEPFQLPFEQEVIFCDKDNVLELLKEHKLDEPNSFEMFINSFETISEKSINNVIELTSKISNFDYYILYIPVLYNFDFGPISNKEIRIVKNSYPAALNLIDLSNLIKEPINPVLASNILVKSNEPTLNQESFLKRLKKANKRVRAIKEPTAEQLYDMARFLYANKEFAAIKTLIENHSYVLKNTEYTVNFFKLLFTSAKALKSKEMFEISSHLIQHYNKDPRFLMDLANAYLDLGFEEDYMPRAARSFRLPVPNESELIYSELALNLPRFIDLSLNRGEYINVFEVVPKYAKLGLVPNELFRKFVDFQLQSIQNDLDLTQIILKNIEDESLSTPLLIDYRLWKGLKNNFDNSKLTDSQKTLKSYWWNEKSIFKNLFRKLLPEEQERIIISAAVFDHKEGIRMNGIFRFNNLYRKIRNLLNSNCVSVEKLKSQQIANLFEEFILYRDFESLNSALVRSEEFTVGTVELLKPLFQKYHFSEAELGCVVILLNSSPKDFSLWLRGGELLFVSGRIKEAISYLEVARKLNKKSNKAVEMLILAYEKESMYQEAKNLAASLPKESLISNFIYHRHI